MFNTTFANKKSAKSKKKIVSKRRVKTVSLRLAVIDLGTNSVRMDVYRVSDNRIFRTYRLKLMVRLGDGVFKTGKLSKAGQERTIRAFHGFKKILRDMRVSHVVAFGTSALRTASNAKPFVVQLKELTGIHIRVISGKEEGRLIAKGILANIQPPQCVYVLIDIGGGSTEISFCRGEKILHSFSYQLGANRLQQMFVPDNPPVFRSGQLHPALALRQHLKTELRSLVRRAGQYKPEFAIGSSGTIRSIGRIMKKNNLNEKVVLRPDVSALSSELQLMNKEQIKKIPGLEPKRVDLILAGSILLDEVLQALSIKELVVTDLALRDGILQSELERSQLSQPKRKK